jgi:uncharacterized protein YlaI
MIRKCKGCGKTLVVEYKRMGRPEKNYSSKAMMTSKQGVLCEHTWMCNKCYERMIIEIIGRTNLFDPFKRY